MAFLKPNKSSSRMKTKDIATHAAWHRWIAVLPWNPKHAEESVSLALSKAY